MNPTSSFPRVPLLVLGSFLLPWTPQFVYELSSIPAVFFLARMTRLSPIARKTLRKAVRDAPQPTAVQRLELPREFTIDTARLRQFTEPVLLFGSRGDRILPSVEEVYRLAGVFPNARTVILPHSGHACLLESDLDLIAILRETRFLPV
ncbi:alpha/beta fold hydrolase [Pannus brasiliensis CCIBt3594]|uniref:Alpha/beta fold hydrolase n=1 Tax=Pannus brasiliensis CCIBt3594 TaxID=1427578 RepID=A0AAW9QSQ1_9CHRO